MKKVLTLIFISIVIISLAACGKNQVSNIDEKIVNQLMTEYLELKDLPEKYDTEQAKNYGDVVSIHGKVYNNEKLTTFMEKYNKQEPAMVRITHLTIEGNAIIKDLMYDGNSLLLKEDNTRDKFAAPEDRKVIAYKISDIIVTEREGGTEYNGRLENGEMIQIAWIIGK